MLATWKEWHSEKLLSDEKYRRLTRTTALTREELCGYVNRQLVEVSAEYKGSCGAAAPDHAGENRDRLCEGRARSGFPPEIRSFISTQ